MIEFDVRSWQGPHEWRQFALSQALQLLSKHFASSSRHYCAVIQARAQRVASVVVDVGILDVFVVIVIINAGKEEHVDAEKFSPLFAAISSCCGAQRRYRLAVVVDVTVSVAAASSGIIFIINEIATSFVDDCPPILVRDVFTRIMVVVAVVVAVVDVGGR